MTGCAAVHAGPAEEFALQEDVRNVCMVVSYDGTRFKGFQLQVC